MKKFLEVLPDCLGVAGLALISFGAWRIYHPAGYIVGGLCLVGLAYLAQRDAE